MLSLTGANKTTQRLAWALGIGLIGLIVGLSIMLVVREASAQSSSVCDRTQQVREAIVEASGASSCSQVTTLHHLREITSLDLSNEGITSLSADDFDGLVRLRTLDLSNNSLTALPAGVFDELYLLRTLRLDNNQLATVPPDIFDELFLLEELTLSGNPSLSLPSGMFGDFSALAGMLASGALPDNSGAYPRINRFLSKHSVTSPEEFIEALPDLYKERFTIVYASEALAQDHVSGEHPRIISFGGDGGFTFAWSTDPDAPSEFREVIEFLRGNDDDWTAGVIDFSGESPAITTPGSCQVCHGSLNKPLWGAFDNWDGTEYVKLEDPAVDEVVAWNEAVVASTDARIEPLDISASYYVDDQLRSRLMQTAGQTRYATAVEEAGSVWSWRHAEVLFERLKAREDYRSFAEETVCNSEPLTARLHALGPFSLGDHNLAVLSNTNQVVQGGSIGNAFVGPDYHYHPGGELGAALVFLMVVDLWDQEPIVRQLYRDTSNADTIAPGRRWEANSLLYYYGEYATAEDELIQKYRLHFGRGNRAVLAARAVQNVRYGAAGGNFTAAFYDGHLEVMAPRVCDALRNGRPTNLDVELAGGNAVLRWEAPEYDTDSLTGYRILRGVGGATPTVHVADTGSTNTTWTDGSPSRGEYVYVVKAIYDD